MEAIAVAIGAGVLVVVTVFVILYYVCSGDIGKKGP